MAIVVLAVACREAETEVTPKPSATASPGSASPTATPHTGSLPPVGTIAYVGTDGYLWVRYADGNQVRIYAPPNGYVSYPEWSPDGTLIAFTEKSRSGEAQGSWVVVVNLDGAELLRVPRALLPHWSPDNTRLAVATEPRSEDLQFFTTPAIADVRTGLLRRLASEMVTWDAPRWSPDGGSLTYSNLGGLFVVSAEPGSAPRLLLDGEAYTLWYLTPVWSADGRVLVWEGDKTVEPASGNYLVVDLEHGIISRVDDSNPLKCGREAVLQEAEADWVPGTSLAAWGVECGARAGIWVKDMTGGDGSLIDVSSLTDVVGALDVSPDGRLIAFSDARAHWVSAPAVYGIGTDTTVSIYLVGVEGGDAQLFIPDAWQPAWQPQP